MSDVADMLGIAGAAKQQLTAGEEATKILMDKQKAVSSDKKKKPKGMKREVFDLMAKDGIAPSVQTTSMNPVFKSKRSLANEGKWVWAAIESSARPDNLKALHHWVRADKFYPDYPYAQFNVKMDKLSFTDEQYTSLLDQPGWTKEDTQTLLDTSRAYDLRWPVIADRIVLSTDKKSEELQARYYFVYNTIQQANAVANAPAFGGPASVKMYNYDLDKEAMRRKKQDQLYYRTKEDEKEEIKLREELKAINEQLKKLKKTMKTAARESTTATAVMPPVKSEGVVASEGDPARIGQYLAEGKTMLEASTTNPIDGSDPTAVAPVAIRELAPQAGKPALQSCRLYMTGSQPIGKQVFTKMNSYLRELNIPERPVPTKRVCDLVDMIRRDAQALIALQNQFRKKEKDATQAKQGTFKTMVGNGRTSSEQAISASKAIATKAEKAAKPKAPPKPRQQKKDAANSALTSSTDAAQLDGGVLIKEEPGLDGSKGVSHLPDNLLDDFVTGGVDSAMDIIDGMGPSIFDLPLDKALDSPPAAAAGASRKRNRSKVT